MLTRFKDFASTLVAAVLFVVIGLMLIGAMEDPRDLITVSPPTIDRVKYGAFLGPH